MSRRYDRRELLTAGLGLFVLPRGVAWSEARPGARADDLPQAGAWAERALAALGEAGIGFLPSDDGAGCELGAEGRLEVAREGEGAVAVTLRGSLGGLEILRPLESAQVARVEARLLEPVDAPPGPCYDTLRRVPGGFELTFSSALALRHVMPRTVAGEPPAVYGRLAAAAVEGARRFLC